VSRRPPAARGDFRAWRRLTTRWADNDVYGHVNNTVYYQWFDSAVNAWLVEQGLLDIAGGDLIALVVETRCTYHAPLAFPTEVEVGLAVAEVSRSSVRYRLGVFSAGGEAAVADGEFVHVAVERNSRKPMPWPAEWRTAFEAIS
jgi:acyl-CoA thioester hydrolase